VLARASDLIATAADWLYPRACPGCDALSDRPGRHLCSQCLAQIRLHDRSLCSACGAQAEGEVRHGFVCDACRAWRPAFDRARSAGYFQGVLRELTHQFKYSGALWLRHDLADLLLGCLSAHFEAGAVDAVVPVPLHALRERERSYNQSALLAQEVAARLGRRFDGRALVRTRRTESQTAFDVARRHANVLGAFTAARPEWVARRCVLLVDDVMTTGATLSECARALKKAGARAVWAVTVARG
jgi:ComF family protein